MKHDLNLILKKDKVLSEIYTTYQAPPNWQRSTGFTTLCQIILEQQVSLSSAKAHFEKLNAYVTKFSPDCIIKLSDEEMRNCFISRQKATYLKELSRAILEQDLDLDSLESLSEPEIRKKLTSIKGIGNWTTDIYLMFSLQKKDIFPIGDIAVRNTMKTLYGVHSTEEMIRIAENWKPYRSLGTYFMWHHYLKSRSRNAIY